METAMRLSDAHTHALVDCIPVSPAVTAKAPLYFKKGIDDAESEWSQHHAKRMIETGGKVGRHTHEGLVVYAVKLPMTAKCLVEIGGHVCIYTHKRAGLQSSIATAKFFVATEGNGFQIQRIKVQSPFLLFDSLALYKVCNEKWFEEWVGIASNRNVMNSVKSFRTIDMKELPFLGNWMISQLTRHLQ